MHVNVARAHTVLQLDGDFKFAPSSRRSFRIEVSVLAVGWIPVGAAGTRAAGVSVATRAARVVAVLVCLPGVVSFWSQFVYPRLVARVRESLQVVQKFLQIELDSEEHRARVSLP